MRKSLNEIIAELSEKMRLIEQGTWRGYLRARYSPWFRELTYGIDVRDGWRELVEETLERIAQAVGGLDECPELRIKRLREKFGALTMQIDGIPDDRLAAVRDVIGTAMERSLYTCEICGRPGQQGDVEQDDWRVRCEDHWGER